MSDGSRQGISGFVNDLEETLIAFLLGAMTLITFANVVARYVFNSNLLWALETTVYLFAWLVLLGAAYVVKVSGHLGIDIVLNMVDRPKRRMLGLLAVGCCLLYALLLLIGTWQYWTPFIGEQAWYEVDDILMPDWLRFIEPILNEGEPYEKLPRFIPYFALPLGMVLITFRFLQLGWRIWHGEIDRMIASHEAEDMEISETSTPDARN